jgi:hypothetical protein
VNALTNRTVSPTGRSRIRTGQCPCLAYDGRNDIAFAIGTLDDPAEPSTAIDAGGLAVESNRVRPGKRAFASADVLWSFGEDLTNPADELTALPKLCDTTH